MSQMYKGLPSYKKPVNVVVKPNRQPVRNEIKNIKKSIKKINNEVELKYADVVVGATTFDTGGSISLLNSVDVGNTEYTRSGTDIRATSIQLRITIKCDPSQTAVTTITPAVRLMLVWDSQPNGAVPILASTAAIPGILDNRIISLYLAPYNRVTQKRYKILHDKLYDMNSMTSSTATPFLTWGDRHIRIKLPLGRTIKYDSTGGGIADITTNSLYFIAISSVTADMPSYILGSRMYFKNL